MYDDKKITEYNGVANYNGVVNFIEEKYFFKCKEIKSQENLREKIYLLNKNRFFIGIFEYKKIFVDFYINLMKENIQLVENCFYYINTANEYFYSNLKNYIIINNSEKLNIFENIDFISEFSDIKIVEFTNKEIKVLKESFKEYILSDSFPTQQEFSLDKMNLYHEIKKFRVIFSYDLKNKDFFFKILKKFSVYRENLLNYQIFTYDLDNPTASLEESQFFKFTQESGIFFTDQIFENDYAFLIPDIKLEKINEFANKNIKDYKESQKSNKNQAILIDNQNEGKNIVDKQKINSKKYVTAKIVEKLDIPGNENKEVAKIDNVNKNIVENIQEFKLSEKNKLEENYINVGDEKNKKEK